MSIVTMSMSQYEVERDEPVAGMYDRDFQCTDWEPSLGLQQHVHTEPRPAAMPLELVTVDVDVFLKKMYAYQR